MKRYDFKLNDCGDVEQVSRRFSIPLLRSELGSALAISLGSSQIASPVPRPDTVDGTSERPSNANY